MNYEGVDVRTLDSSSTPPPSNTRAQIIEAARRELATRGLARMTIRQVARAVGVDPGTVRHYFSAKEDLAQAAADSEVDMAAGYLELAARSSDGAGLVAAAARYIPDSDMSRAAVAVCLTGGEFERTVFGTFARDVVAPVARQRGTNGYEERVAAVMSVLLGIHLLWTVLPDSKRILREANGRAVLAQSIDGYLVTRGT